jgi:hypothetical protein
MQNREREQIVSVARAAVGTPWRMARTVTDLVHLLEVIAGLDPADPATV